MKIRDDVLCQQLYFNPHNGQMEVLKSGARDITICAGTRWGKSKMCAYVAFKHLLADNQRIWIVSLCMIS